MRKRFPVVLLLSILAVIPSAWPFVAAADRRS